MSDNDKSQAKIDYVRDHVLPWLLEHIRARTVGFQIFAAVQGALLIAYTKFVDPQIPASWLIPILGLSSCLSFHMWDKRNRFVFKTFSAIGAKFVDEPIFGAETGDESQNWGLYTLITKISDIHSHPTRKHWRHNIFSHTRAMQVLNITSASIWLFLLVEHFAGTWC